MKKDLRITICRRQKDGTTTFRRWTTEELMEEISSHRYDDIITRFRTEYPLVQRELLTVQQILEILKEKSPDCQMNEGAKVTIGRAMISAGFSTQRGHTGKFYRVIRR